MLSTSVTRLKSRAGTVGHDAAVAHHHDPVGGRQDLVEKVRDENHRPAFGDEVSHEGEQLAGQHAVQRRGRLVEDDEANRRVGGRECAGDLDHLPPRDGKIADDLRRVDVVAREDRVELAADQGGGAAAPADAPSATDA